MNSPTVLVGLFFFYLSLRQPLPNPPRFLAYHTLKPEMVDVSHVRPPRGTAWIPVPRFIIMQKLFSTLLLVIVLANACTTITVEPDAPIPTVSYQQDIAPIIASNCGQSGCHGTESTEKFNLLSFAALSKLVEPNQPHKSELYNVIRIYDNGAMPPPPNAPLSDVQIGQIYVWILQGATNN